MSKKIQINIPEPCHKKFNEMIPAHGGNFCNSCEKVIVDFTKMSDKEIMDTFLKNKGKICGQFRKDQLNRNIHLTQAALNSYRGKVASILLSSMIATGISNAQNNTSPITPNANQHLAGLVVNNSTNKMVTNSISIQPQKTIKLKVIDEAGESLIGASIAFKNHEKYGTTSDIDGSAKIEIPNAIKEKEVILIISYTGYTSIELSINRDEFNFDKVNNVNLNQGGFLLGYTIVTGYAKPQPRTLYHVVRSWIYKLKYNHGFSRERRREQREERREQRIENRADRKEEKKAARIAENNKKIKNESVNKIIQLPAQQFPVSIKNIFPNPFSDEINVEVFSEIKSDIQISLFDISGKKIYHVTQGLVKGNQNIKLNLQNLRLENGEYILHLREKNGQVQSRKLVKISLGDFKLKN